MPTGAPGGGDANELPCQEYLNSTNNFANRVIHAVSENILYCASETNTTPSPPH